MFELIISAPNTGTKFIPGKGLSDMMDKYLVFSRNRADLAPGTGVLLAKEVNGKLQRLRGFAVPVIEAPAPVVEDQELEAPKVKLSEAMRKVLEADESESLGLPGRANTFKALEARGLVKVTMGIARRTELGNKYARKG